MSLACYSRALALELVENFTGNIFYTQFYELFSVFMSLQSIN